MNISITIKDFCPMALTEDDGLSVRTKIEEHWNTSEIITLDFADIDVFATPFFNSSIGFFILKLTPEKVSGKIKLINLSNLGEETFLHSRQNAEEVYKRKFGTDEIGKLSEETIINK